MITVYDYVIRKCDRIYIHVKGVWKITFVSSRQERKVNLVIMNAKIFALCIVLPCLIALVAAANYAPNVHYVPYGYGQQGGAQQGAGQYAAYAANSQQALRQARLFNYLLGGLYFLNLFNVTGNKIVG